SRQNAQTPGTPKPHQKLPHSRSTRLNQRRWNFSDRLGEGPEPCAWNRSSRNEATPFRPPQEKLTWSPSLTPLLILPIFLPPGHRTRTQASRPTRLHQSLSPDPCRETRHRPS